jgi:hypothetical protein
MESNGLPKHIVRGNDDGDYGRNDDNENNGHSRKHTSTRLDLTDLKLMDLMLSGQTIRESAKTLGMPLSTIQRRARLLVQRDVLKPTFELGYSRLGVKKGFLHVYLDGGDVPDTVDKLLTREGVFSVGVHLGNSDIVALFVFHDSQKVLDLIGWTKHQDGVGKVVWSEEVYAKNTSPKLEKVIGIDGKGLKMRLAE